MGPTVAFSSTERIIIPVLPWLWSANCGFDNYPIETQSCYTSILNTKSYSIAIFPRNIFIADSSFYLGSRRTRKYCLTEMLLKWRWDHNTRFLPLPLVRADVDAILAQSSRIWPSLNTPNTSSKGWAFGVASNVRGEVSSTSLFWTQDVSEDQCAS